MKIVKIIITLLILILPGFADAAIKGYNVGGGFGWSVASGGRCCSGGRTLLGIYANRAQGRSGSAQCFTPDDGKPVITFSGYQNNTWVNHNVNLKVNVSDAKSGLGQIFYYVNGVKYNGSSNFTISLTEEGIYNIAVYAYDKATVSASNGAPVVANLGSKSYIVKIDKTEPKFSKWTKPIKGWFKSKPKVEYRVQDLYKGQGEDLGDGAAVILDIITKEFSCLANPANSSYEYPVVSGKVTGTCDPNVKDCNNNSNFIPNNSSCVWKCDQGYIKVGNSCILKELNLSCNDGTLKIPDSVYEYDKFQNLVNDGSSEGRIFWYQPSGIAVNGDFIATYNETTSLYEPSINSCNYNCSDGYHIEANQGYKCVNDTSIICCEKPPLGNIADLGGAVDCSLAINSALPQCAYNPLCNGYIKDVLGDWNNLKKAWEYDDSTGKLYGNVSNACGYTNLPNSNGYVCNKRYYLIGTEANNNQECISVPVGEWSNDIKSGSDGNNKYPCTNGPKNSYYTSNGDNNNCSFTCNAGSESKGGKCISYNWVTSSYGSCNTSCGTGTKYRSVTCKDSEGNTVNDKKCKTAKPSTTISCTIYSGCSYSWKTGAWGTCSVNCGGGTQTRTVYCQRSNGTNVSDSYCSGTKPSSSQSCSTQSCYSGGGTCTEKTWPNGDFDCGGTPSNPSSTWVWTGAGKSGGCYSPYYKKNQKYSSVTSSLISYSCYRNP